MKKQQEHQMKQYEKLIDQIFKNAMKKKNNEETNKMNEDKREEIKNNEDNGINNNSHINMNNDGTSVISSVQSKSKVISQHIRSESDDSVSSSKISKSKVTTVNNANGHNAEDTDDEAGEKLMQKLKHGIKETQDGTFVFNTDTHHKAKTTVGTNIALSPQTHTVINKKKAKENNKFEKYNVEKIAYDAYKNYSQCRPKEKDFLSRMKFYAIKTQTRNEIIDILIKKNKPKIKESEKIQTFNRLIKDSNRRAEARNRIEMLNTNKKIASEIYDTDMLITKQRSKRKFDKLKFDEEYEEKVTKKLKEREKSIEYYRRKKEEEEKRKEEEILNEMKKYHKTASREKIDLISQRMYSEAIARRIKNELINSVNEMPSKRIKRTKTLSELNEPMNTNFNIRRNIRAKSNKNSFIREVNRNGNINTNRSRGIKSKKNSIISNQSNVTSKTTKEKYCPYYTAEKMVNAFFNQ